MYVKGLLACFGLLGHYWDHSCAYMLVFWGFRPFNPYFSIPNFQHHSYSFVSICSDGRPVVNVNPGVETVYGFWLDFFKNIAFPQECKVCREKWSVWDLRAWNVLLNLVVCASSTC